MDVIERPILFSGPMVQGILKNWKTNTRRVINKLLRAKFTSCSYARISEFHRSRTPGYEWTFRDKNLRWHDFDSTQKVLDLCPYGKVGDRFWVREAWRVGAWNALKCSIAVDYRADGYARREWLPVPEEMYKRYEIQCLADCEKAYGKQDRYEWQAGEGPFGWRPSIHMPRWASRIMLEIVDIRIEQLQNISEESAKAEGVEPMENPGLQGAGASYRLGFSHLWDSLNAKRGYSWESNPWVWAISFKLLDRK